MTCNNDPKNKSTEDNVQEEETVPEEVMEEVEEEAAAQGWSASFAD